MHIPTYLLGAALLAAALSAPAADRDDAASEKLGIKLSLQCWTYRELTFFEAVDRAKTLGIKYIEMFPGQKLKPGSEQKVGRGMDDAMADEIKAKLALNGQSLIAYGVDGIPDKEADARKDFEWAKKMGIQVLVTETNPSELLDKLCDEYKIKMALHNHPQSWPPEKVLEATKGHSPLVGSCSDTGHWQRRGWIPVEQREKLQGRVLHSHFKDLTKLAGDGHDTIWGTGVGDAKGMLAELVKLKYKGFCSIEYESTPVAELDVNLPKCVAFFDQTLTELAK
jgi:sugar phosphate isomerase/epimerase